VAIYDKICGVALPNRCWYHRARGRGPI